MRVLKRIIIHCSATPPEMDIGVEEINDWHLARGWAGIGYHYVIRRNGVVEDGRPIERQGAHVSGHNKDSVGICLVGGKESKQTDNTKDHFTVLQIESLIELIKNLQATYSTGHTDIDYETLSVHGHNDFSSKGCPGFTVNGWWASVLADPILSPHTADVELSDIDSMIQIVDAIDDQLSDMRQMLLNMQKRDG